MSVPSEGVLDLSHEHMRNAQSKTERKNKSECLKIGFIIVSFLNMVYLRENKKGTSVFHPFFCLNDITVF